MKTILTILAAFLLVSCEKKGRLQIDYECPSTHTDSILTLEFEPLENCIEASNEMLKTISGSCPDFKATQIDCRGVK